MKALVIGHGSIGARHARILEDLGCRVGVVSRRVIDHPRRFGNVGDALTDMNPDYVVVATVTGEHFAALETLSGLGFTGRVLVEKPLFDRYRPLPPHEFQLAAVGYNLRCHPVLRALDDFLSNSGGAVTASIYAGSYLPDWRPERDYRSGYSARAPEGGGVLRDLSHELDYALWLFGGWRRVAAAGGRFSTLEIESDDAYSMLLKTERCPLVTIHVNYLDRVPRRHVIANTGSHTAAADLVENRLLIDGSEQVAVVARDDTYREQHRSILAGDASQLCSLEEGLEVVALIEAAERACSSGQAQER